MNAQEVIDIMKIAIAEVEWNYPLDYAIAFEEAIKALEKQIPKKPFYDKNRDDFNAYKCPVCNDEYMILSGDNYCTVCGQALDWSDIE